MKGQKRTGRLFGDGRVFCKSDFWIAKYVDENDKVREVSTKTKSKEAAQKILTKLENEVTRIRAGVMTREEINRSAASATPISEFVEQYRVKLAASRRTKKHIGGTIQKINDLLSVCQATKLSEITRNCIEEWIASEPRQSPSCKKRRVMCRDQKSL